MQPSHDAMDAESTRDILAAQGFCLIGQLAYRLHLSIWWHPRHKIQALVVSLGRAHLIKADKAYYLTSIGAAGETWARDIGPLQDYLESHFPELRLAFAYFRDVPACLAELEVGRRSAFEAPTRPTPTVAEIARLQQELIRRQQQVRKTQELAQASSGLTVTRGQSAALHPTTNILDWYLHQQATSEQRAIAQLQEQLASHQQRREVLEHLQREYQQKGSATVFTFSISSNLQTAHSPQEFAAAIQSVVTELLELHRYQVTQKLTGGRLAVHVAEAEEPVMTWIEQWLGGALSPMQLARLGEDFKLLREAAHAHVMVTPDDDIQTNDGTVRCAAKHLAAHTVSSLLSRIDSTDRAAGTQDVPPTDLPAFLGNRADEHGRSLGKAIFPLSHMIHAYVSGTTGSGKSYLARVLVEEAARYESVSILVLDPRNQAVGLLHPEDRPEVLSWYAKFKMPETSARGFAFDYYAPSLGVGTTMPQDPSVLATGRHVVSFKGMDDRQRCLKFAQILDAVFQHCAQQESPALRLLVVVEEAQNFTRKRVDDTADEAAAQAERALERIAREGRKYGMCLTLISQSIKDFARDSISIRQNINTRIFLRNSDRELEYAADFLDDVRQLVALPVATGIVHRADGPVFRLNVRPPYSKIFEPGDAELRAMMGGAASSAALSPEAQRILDAVTRMQAQGIQPINLSQVASEAQITSKRRLQAAITELETAGTIRTHRLCERGQPRVIELVQHPGPQI